MLSVQTGVYEIRVSSLQHGSSELIRIKRSSVLAPWYIPYWQLTGEPAAQQSLASSELYKHRECHGTGEANMVEQYLAVDNKQSLGSCVCDLNPSVVVFCAVTLSRLSSQFSN